MNIPQRLMASTLVACATLGTAAAAGVGDQLDIEFEDFTATAATSIEDFSGRAILIEYFAYW